MSDTSLSRPPIPEGGPTSTGGVSRRSVVAAAAWSVPVVSVAVATPARAASMSYDLAATRLSAGGNALQPLDQAPVRVEGGRYWYDVPGTYETRAYFRNVGDAVPAGATFTFTQNYYPAAGTTIRINNFNGAAPELGFSASTVVPVGQPTFSGAPVTGTGTASQTFRFTVPIPAGVDWSFQMQFIVGDVPTGGAATEGRVSVAIAPPAGVVDAAPENNTVSRSDIGYLPAPGYDLSITRVSAGGDLNQPFDQTSTPIGGGRHLYNAPASYDTRVAFRNVDTAVPAGSTFTFSLSHYPASGAVINIKDFQQGSAENGFSPATVVPVGGLSFSGSPLTPEGTVSQTFRFTVPIPVGANWMFQMHFAVGGTSAGVSGEGHVTAAIATPPGVVDSTPANNSVSRADISYPDQAGRPLVIYLNENGKYMAFDSSGNSGGMYNSYAEAASHAVNYIIPAFGTTGQIKLASSGATVGVGDGVRTNRLTLTSNYSSWDLGSDGTLLNYGWNRSWSMGLDYNGYEKLAMLLRGYGAKIVLS